MIASAPATPSSAAANPQGPVLRDIHLPPDPSWWPPAPGWWMLLGLLLSLAIAGWLLWRRHRRELQRHARILAELDHLADIYRRDGDLATFVGAMHQLLRRVARRHDIRATQQRGDAWRQTLARVPVDAATLEQLMSLEQAIYRAPGTFDHSAAASAVRRWLQLALKPAKWKRVRSDDRKKGLGE